MVALQRAGSGSLGDKASLGAGAVNFQNGPT